MSLIYVKSNRFIKDINSRKITGSGELAHQFTAQFKEPINITPKSKIELISADLNIDSIHEISDDKLNDSFVVGFGEENIVTVSLATFSDKSFQVPIRLTDGRYTNSQLANEIERTFNNSNLYDNMKLSVKFDNSLDKFVGKFVMEDLSIQNNVYGMIAQKMGYQEADINLATGVGTRASQSMFINNGSQKQNTFQDNGFDLTDTNITLSGTPSDKLLPVNLLSNIATPTSNGSGVSNFDGALCSVITPTKMRVFPEDWTTKFTGNFNVTLNGTTTACTFTSGTGSYDFKINGINSNKYEGKLVYNKTQWNATPQPDVAFTYDAATNVDMEKLPYGQLLIINDQTVLNAANSVLKSNQIVLVYREQQSGNGWQLFYTDVPTTSITEFTIQDNDDQDMYKESQVVSMGFYSGGIGLTRGETALTGTNQMNTTNKFTRTRVENVPGTFADIEVDSKIYADYSFQVCPKKGVLEESILTMRSGIVGTDKFAGDASWLSVPDADASNSFDLSDISEDLDVTQDNIILVAEMLDYRNVKLLIAHDTAGDGKFINLTLIGDTTISSGQPGHLPINFNQSSYPIMPIVLPGNGYISLGQETHIVGKYSKNKSGQKNLQTIRNLVNTEFNETFNIPGRQPKSTISSFGDLSDFTESSKLDFDNRYDEPLEQPEGTILDGSGNVVIELPDSTTEVVEDEKQYDNTSQSPFVARFGEPSAEDAAELIDNNLSIEPNLPTRLYRNLGFNETEIVKSVDQPFSDGSTYISNLNSNYIVNIENLGNIKGQNSGTKTISRMIGVIPSAELQNDENSGTKHFVSQYPNPVHINAKTDEKVNNFMISITDDENYAATDLRHPTNLLIKITE